MNTNEKHSITERAFGGLWKLFLFGIYDYLVLIMFDYLKLECVYILIHSVCIYENESMFELHKNKFEKSYEVLIDIFFALLGSWINLYLFEGNK